MRAFLLVVPGLLLLTGCLPEQWLNPSGEPDVLLVPSSPFSTPAPVTTTAARMNYAAGDKELALHVSQVGRQLLTANPEIGMSPKFALFGTPNVELFHHGTYLVNITEGLVIKCPTDGRLAAVLAHQLALMVVEREALANPRMRTGDKRPPPEPIIGNGIGDRDSDQLRLAELARYEKKTRLEEKTPPPLPDPEKLARMYLEKAGYDRAELDAVRPLLTEAERTYVLEKQFKQSGALEKWAPAPGAKGNAPVILAPAPGAKDDAAVILAPAPATEGSLPPNPAIKFMPGPGAPGNGIPINKAPPLTVPTAPGLVNVQLPASFSEEGNQKSAPGPVWAPAPASGP